MIRTISAMNARSSREQVDELQPPPFGGRRHVGGVAERSTVDARSSRRSCALVALPMPP